MIESDNSNKENSGAMLPHLCPCNKVLKPNFQTIISQTNNGCSLPSLILAKLLLLDISCENIFALCIVTALTACPFSIKQCATVSFFCENRKNLLAAGGVAPTPYWPPAAGGFTSDHRLCPLPPLPNPGCATALVAAIVILAD